ncbi:TlpA disulfide reductase family protein [Oribacterium sp. Sow4_G1_1]|uniref:TlpA disulfide reductase family protein n=1 Tax=Oribacterium sp. Sow4_G1_1 TaxID=3438794 RepID=UPI003F9DA867
MTKIETFALAFALSLSLAACGGAANTNSAAATAAAGAESVDGSMGAESSDTGNETAGTVAGGAGIGTGNAADLATLMTEEPADAHAATELYQALMAQENEILAEDSALWEKVFLSIDKDQQKLDEGADYGDYLLKAIDGAKEQFTTDELARLNTAGEKVKKIEGKLSALEEKYPDCATQPDDSASAGAAGESVSAGSAGMTGDTGVSGMTGGSANTAGGDAGTAGDSADAFPSFEGQDLDGNPVDSATLFSNNAVTVVNFWFTTCKPCVGELPDLEALHQELAKKGGTVIGINAFTLDGSTKDTNEAKSVLEQQGVTYPNIWFASNSDAGLFTAGLYAFPTTYVVDRNGRIVGDPIVGGISSDAQMKKLNALIDQALS